MERYTSDIVIFDIVEGTNLGSYRQRQDDFFTKLTAKLIQYPALLKRRDLSVKVNVVTFAPAVRVEEEDDIGEYPIFGRDDGLIDFITDIEWKESSLFPALAAAIQALSMIKKGRRRRSTFKFGETLTVAERAITHVAC